MASLSSGFIVLILNVDGVDLHDFWPISFMDSIYNLIAKVLAYLLSHIIVQVVGES